jgi:hypothetical protein
VARSRSARAPDPEAVRRALVAATRAPSAHNAQPWRLSQTAPNSYLLWYAFADKLQADPDDRDGIIAVGGFFETLSLAGQAEGIEVAFASAQARTAEGIVLGSVGFAPLETPPDELARAIAKRQCNRARYDTRPVPPGLAHGLAELGNLLLGPESVAGLVFRASVLSWRDRRFVSDLREWTRFDDGAPDGMTLDCLRVRGLDPFWLRLALALGRLPGWLAWAYAQRDVRLTRASSAMAVLMVPDRDPLTLFHCGRRLIRSWTLINSLGYAWHPMSVVIDQPTVDALRDLIGGADPVAIYRIGYTPVAAPWSNRRRLDQVVVAPPA